MYDMGEISLILVLIILHINYMFVLNYGGEEIQSHGIKLSKATWVFCNGFKAIYTESVMLKFLLLYSYYLLKEIYAGFV